MAEEPWSWARRMAQGWVSGGVALGWSGAETISFLREVGLGYRRQDVYEDIRRITERTKWECQVTRLDPTSTVPRSWMSEEPEELWHVGVPYKAQGYAAFWSEEEQGFVTKYVSIGVPREMTVDEVYAYVLEEVPWQVYEGKMDVTDFEMIGMSHLKGAGY